MAGRHRKRPRQREHEQGQEQEQDQEQLQSKRWRGHHHDHHDHHQMSASASASASTLTILRTDAAAAPVHRILDVKRVDVEILVQVLNKWIGPPADRIDDLSSVGSSFREEDRTALCFSLMDARFASALFHRYVIRRTQDVRTVTTLLVRRNAQRVSSSSSWSAASPSSVSQGAWRHPAFAQVEGDIAGWSEAASHPILIDNIRTKRLLLPHDTAVVAPLPVTSVVVAGAHSTRPLTDALKLSLQHVPQLTSLTRREISWHSYQPIGWAFATSMLHTPQLRSLRLSGSCVGTDDCSTLAASLRHVAQLTCLDVARCSIGDVGCCTLAASLKDVPLLVELLLNGNRIRNQGVCALAAALHHVPQLTALTVGDADHGYHMDCSSDTQRADAARALAAAIQQHLPRFSTFDWTPMPNACTNVISLTLGGLGFRTFSIEAMSIFSALLDRVPRATEFRIQSRNVHLDRPDQLLSRVLADSLCRLPHLQCFRVEHVCIAGESCRVIAASLPLFPQLHTLALHESKMTASDCRTFAAAFEHVPRLTSLHVNVDNVGSDGCRSLCESLHHLPGLTSLCLYCTNADAGESSHALASSLHHIPQLTSLAVRWDSVTADSMRVLGDAIGQHLLRLTSINGVGFPPTGPNVSAWRLSDQPIDDLAMVVIVASIKRVPRLRTLYLRHVKIGYVGWRALADSLHLVPLLQTLDVQDNSFSDEAALALATAINQHLPSLSSFSRRRMPRRAHVRELDLSWCRIDVVELMVVGGWLRRLPRLTHLNLSNCPIRSHFPFATALRYVPHLLVLDLQRSRMNDEGCQALAVSLHLVPRLTSLDVRHNSFGAAAGHTLFNAMHQHLPHLSTFNELNLPRCCTDETSLDLLHRPLHGEEALFVAASLVRVPQLTTLTLEVRGGHAPSAVGYVRHAKPRTLRGLWCRQKASQDPSPPTHGADKAFDEPMRILGEAIARDLPTLVMLNGVLLRQGGRSLDLSRKRLGVLEMIVIAHRLHLSPQVTALNVRSNRIGGAGCCALAAALQHVPHLTWLDLRENVIDGESARALGAAIQQHLPRFSMMNGVEMPVVGDGEEQTVASWDVSRRDLDVVGISVMAAALCRMPHLTTLKMHSNCGGEEGCVAVAQALRHVPQLTLLDIGSNDIRDSGCAALASALHAVPMLKSLSVWGNEIGPVGCGALAHALQHVPQLTSLDVHRNWIDEAGCEALAQSLHHVPQLAQLDVSWNGFGVLGEKDSCASIALALLRERIELVFA